MMSRATEIRYDAPGVPAVRQTGLNRFDLSYNPDDQKWYVCDWNTYGDLETRAMFKGDRKGLANARAFMRRSVPRNPEHGGA